MHQARSDGATWSAIGESMGVSKQAAQKRFVVAVADRDDGLLSRFTPCARHVLSAARVDAQRGGAPEVETVHLVLALVEDPDGLAARALAEMGAGAEQVRAAVAEVVAGETGETAEIPGAVRGRVEDSAATCGGGGPATAAQLHRDGAPAPGHRR